MKQIFILFSLLGSFAIGNGMDMICGTFWICESGVATFDSAKFNSLVSVKEINPETFVRNVPYEANLLCSSTKVVKKVVRIYSIDNHFFNHF